MTDLNYVLELEDRLESIREELLNQEEVIIKLKQVNKELEALLKAKLIGYVQPFVVEKGLNGYTATLNPEQEGKYTVPVYSSIGTI